MVNPYANKPRTQCKQFKRKPRFQDIPRCPKCPCPIPKPPIFFPKDVTRVFRAAKFYLIQARLNSLVDKLEEMRLRCNVKECRYKIPVTGNTCCPFCYEVFCTYHRLYKNHDCSRDLPNVEKYNCRKHLPLRICKIFRPPVIPPYDRDAPVIKVTPTRVCYPYRCKPKKKLRDVELVVLKSQMNTILKKAKKNSCCT